jgi:hypothetical protein
MLRRRFRRIVEEYENTDPGAKHRQAMKPGASCRPGDHRRR